MHRLLRAISPRHRSSLKTVSRQVSLGVLLIVFLATQLAALSIFLPQHTSAANTADTTDPFLDKEKSKNLELVYDFIERCTTDGKQGAKTDGTFNDGQIVEFTNEVNRERMDAGEVFNYNTDLGGTHYGGERKQPVSNIFGNNKSKQCQEMTKTVGTALYGSYDKFRDTFWEPDGNQWVLKAPYKDERGQTTIALRQAAQELYYTGDSPRITFGYRWNVLRGPFDACFERTTGASGSTPDSMSQFTGTDGKKYAYKAGQENATVYVGPIIDALGIFGGNNDGKWSCKDFKENIVAHKDWFRSVFVKDYPQQTRQAAENADLAASKQENIFNTLSNNNTKLVACLQQYGTGSNDLKSLLTKITNVQPITSGIPDLGQIEQVGADSYATATTTYQSITTWLIANPKNDKPPKVMIGDSTTPGITAVDATKAKEFRDCVLTGYTSINTELEREPPTIAPTEAGGTDEADNSCEAKGDSLGWILCPVANAIDKIVSWLDDQVQNFMKVGIDDTGLASLKKAWSNLRNIAYIILIPIMLVMVIGTALGVQMFDAYTIKKAMPRMVLAILFMALSWYFCVFLINLTNALGNGVQGIILQPFSGAQSMGLGDLLSHAGATAAGGSGTVIGIAAGFGAFLGGIASLGIIISSLGSVAIVLGIAFMLLAARQVIILGLLVASPLAILAWIFPGNDKMWKFWWSAFSKLLFLFPVIQAMIAMGKVFAWLVGS